MKRIVLGSITALMVIAVVALVVIGPERLPKVARTLGHLFGRLQRYVNDVKADISREMELDELRKFKDQFEDAARSVESSVRTEMTGAQATFDAITAEANAEVKELTDAVVPPAPPAEPEAAAPQPGAAETPAQAAAPAPSATPAPEDAGVTPSRPAAAEQKSAA